MNETDAAYRRPADIDERSSFHQRLQWRFEAMLWDVLYWWPMKALGPSQASNALGWLARRIGPRLSQHKTVKSNLALAFPDRTAADREALALDAWENLGRTAGELPHLPSIRPGSHRLDIKGLEAVRALHRSDRPVVYVSGHLANWEAMAIALCHADPDCLITYRALNNPHIDRKLNRLRRAYGIKVLAPKGIGTRSIMRVLKQGKSIGIMNDQKFNQGVAMPFFGRDAMTAPGPARLALKYGAAIVPVSTVRTGPAAFRVVIHDPLDLDADGSGETQTLAAVEQITNFIEDRVRERPGQWFWQHRRWPKEAWRDRRSGPARANEKKTPADD